MKRIVLLVAIGLGIISAFIFQLTSIARHDFYVAHHFGNLIPSLTISVYVFSVFFVALWLVLRKISGVSEKWLKIILLGGFAIIAVIAMLTHPTRSQDIYWSLLLGKGFSHFHLNPYTTQPLALEKDSWAYPILAWKDMTMMYGPVWTLLVSGVSAVTDSLSVALLIMKFIFVGAFVFSVVLFWKIMALLNIPRTKCYQLVFLFMWNPFVIQCVLVDLHNDIFLMLSLLASYYFLLKKHHGASMMALILGGFVKYVPWFFLIIPVYYLLRDTRQGNKRFNTLIRLCVIGLFSLWLFYLPFGGLNPQNLLGLSSQVENVGFSSQFLPGTTLVTVLFGTSFAQDRWFGIFLMLIALVWCLYKNKPLLAYTLPIIFLLFFGTPWFQPWYGLWVLPLFMLYAPVFVVIAVVIFLLVTPELVSPATASIQIPAYAVYVYAVMYFYRLTKKRG